MKFTIIAAVFAAVASAMYPVESETCSALVTVTVTE